MQLKTNVAAGFPLGSYKRSCTNISVQDGVLYASCQDARGRYRDTSIQIPGSYYDLVNCNGMLRVDGC